MDNLRRSENAALPQDCWSGKMLGVYYDQLPHWVVDHGCYAFTFHCADSLPAIALEKLSEMVVANHGVESSDVEYLKESRRRFRMMEHYLDQSCGSCPFKLDQHRKAMSGFLGEYKGALRFRHWVIMPNHLHLLTAPIRFGTLNAFKQASKDFKMKSTHFVNQQLNRSGKLWMSSGYDRWVRDAVEYRRWIRYLETNPVKVGLCQKPEDWIGLH